MFFFTVDTVTDFKYAKPIAVVIGSGPGVSLCLEGKDVSCTCRPEAVDLLIHIVSACLVMFLNTSIWWLKRGRRAANRKGESGTRRLENPLGRVLSVTLVPCDVQAGPAQTGTMCHKTTGTQKPVYLVNYDTLQISNVSC